MTCSKMTALALAFCGLLLSACTAPKSASNSSSSGSSGSCSNATIGASASLVTTSTTNVIPVYMADSSTTGTVGYINEPLVSVTICPPNHTSPSDCQTVSNILLDTGSQGLRVFSSALNSSLALHQETMTFSGQTFNVAQCEVFGSGADWGPVKTADVILGNQTATAIPIQVVDHDFAGMPSWCASLEPDTDPCTAGFNGILGVAPYDYDCGTACASTSTTTNWGIYAACSGSTCYQTYSCSGSTCAIPFATSLQLKNPIAAFGTGFNNGLSMTMPSVALGGEQAVQGTLTIGIGTAAGNDPGSGSFAVYTVDSNGQIDNNGITFRTQFNGTTFGSDADTIAFIDSGSNGLFFPSSGTGLSASTTTGFYIPTSTQSFSAVTLGYTGTTSATIPFYIENSNSLNVDSLKTAVGLGAAVTGIFDWGLPFFLGRTVYVGLEGSNATFNGVTANGPYWAY